MALQLVTAPQVPPVRAQAVIDDLRLDDDTVDQGHVGDLIAAATEYLDGRDGVLGRALIAQTWELFLDAFPRWFRVPLPPCISVDEIGYTDPDGNAQIVNPAIYQVDLASQPARVVLVDGQSWPQTKARTVNAVRLRFTAGYGAAAADVPQPIRRAITQLVNHYYFEREPVGLKARGELPLAVTALLAPYVEPRF